MKVKRNMSDKPFQNIATAIAFSPNMEANVHESFRITKMLGKKLFLVHVGSVNEKQKQTLLRLIENLTTKETQVELLWEEGDVIEAVLSVCKTKNVDLLIAGAQPREGILRYYIGSVARRLVRKTTCSILLMTHPNKLQSNCGKIIVNGIKHPKTENTIATAFEVANCMDANELIVVEEVSPNKQMNKVDDIEHLKQANKEKKALMQEELKRINQLVEALPKKETLDTSTKVIFGKRGYTIGHFTQTSGADLLVMNSPDTKLGFLDRVFTHDLEYVLSELPSDLLIVHSHQTQGN